MARVLIIFFTVILLTTSAFGQNGKAIAIQYVILKDEVINKEIGILITRESNSNDPEHFFKRGLGYIIINIRQYFRSDTLTEYYIEPSMNALKREDPDSKYPVFYNYVGGRPVLIYANALQSTINLVFLPNSKSELRKRLNPYLEKTTSRVFCDASGRKIFKDKHFRSDHFKFDSGKYIYIMKSNSFLKGTNNIIIK